MEWRSHFVATFSSAWRASGLPDPSRHIDQYAAFRAIIPPPVHLIEPVEQVSGPLAGATLRDVHGFGVFFGHVVGRLLALPPAEIDRRADWCGDFNLGISLFDYLSDEAGRAQALLAGPPFDQLVSGPPRPRDASDVPIVSAAEPFLRRLAADVMARLASEVGPPDRQRPDAMWGSLREMMRAEVVMAETRLHASPDLPGLRDVARMKSSGPFRCMAEWMSLASQARGVRASARALGGAIGDCYWLVDDARDIWEDVDAGRWNLFLLAAEGTQPGLFADRFDLATEIRLSRILLSRGWARRITAPTLARLRRTLARTAAAPAVCDEVARLLGVSMERWLR